MPGSSSLPSLSLRLCAGGWMDFRFSEWIVKWQTSDQQIEVVYRESGRNETASTWYKDAAHKYTLVACRLMLRQIIQWEFRAAPCYCCAVIMTVLKGTDYNLRGLRLSQRFWWRLTLPECYTVSTGKALPHVSEERIAFMFRAKPYTKRPPQDMPMLSPSKAEWVDSFLIFILLPLICSL